MKIYELEEQVMVAVCDSDLLGKIFKEGELTLEINEHFYKGETADKKEVANALLSATIANITGARCIGCALENGIITEENIITIDGIPHAQMVKI